MHYVLADANCYEIPCAPYHTFGTPELANDAVKYCGDGDAVLLANHGIIVCGKNLPDREKHSRDDIVIEMRDPEQVLRYRGIPNCLPQVKAIYPSFDVVPPHLISGVVTDQGVYVPYLLDRYFDREVKAFY